MGAEFVCYYTSARSIVNKLEKFCILVEDLQPDIIGITETWGNNSISDALLTPSKLQFIQK